jgi:hypothetical protein
MTTATAELADAYVILPDGSLDRVPADLIPDDVPVIPIHPHADFSDWLLPENDRVLRNCPRIVMRRYLPLLGASRSRMLHIDRTDMVVEYGNRPGLTHDTPLDSLMAGQVVQLDGVPIYPVVSDDPKRQAFYRQMRREGRGHKLAEKRATTRHRDLILTPEEVGRLFAAIDSGTEDERAEANALPYRENDPSCAFHRYQRMRIDGTSHKLAVMLASRSFPGVRTDATFNHGRCNGNQFETHPALGDQYRRLADAAGVSTTGKFYSSGLADFPGDPTAWVSDRGDVLRVARLKGMRVRGDVEHDPGEREPMPDVPIAPEIVKGFVDDYMTQDTGERRADVEERFTRLLTGEVDDNPLLVQDPPANIDL